MSTRAALAVLIGLILPSAAAAKEVDVPLELDHAFVRKLLVAQIYTGADESTRVWDDGSGCNLMILSHPRVDRDGTRLRVTSDGLARVGTAVGDKCLNVLDWKGTVEVLEEPTLDPETPTVRFRVVDSQLFGEGHRKRVTGTLWDWVKAYVHPRFEAVTIDLRPPLDELRAFLPTVLPAGSEEARRLIDSLRLAGVQVTDAGVRLDLRFDVAGQTLHEEALAPEPEPTLSPEELAAWSAQWNQWDAFITFVAKFAAGDSALERQRRALFDVLLAARYDLVEALAPAHAGAPDPIRPLFFSTWQRLAPVMREVSLGLPVDTSLRYLSFITAADALRAIDELGPASGLDLSADGLRRLARMIAPSEADPLSYSDAVDPELRERFGFGPPLPPPEDNPDVPLSWLWPARAWAADDVVARLNRWVPGRDELPQYLPLVRDLLKHTAEATLKRQTLAAEFHQLYRWLVLATAWKESCWRQFIRLNGRIVPMRSGAGAVGIMQVLPRVWRGFYEPKGLQQDIGYNAMAGSDILIHYLRDYAIAKGEHTATGNVDNLARATYAVYNGGPGHLRRYRRSGTKRSLRDIDEAFRDKYLRVKAGDELAVMECWGP
ncbi:MAG: lytic transglycosylase domain-containing protein [Deltaproteobacteria bacterium]|nr:lytic transglycosylase domain-containing protein [Deltaproteobacteria bacterium]